jgi:RNA polymerase sigma-70 factor (ECF subfamily)
MGRAGAARVDVHEEPPRARGRYVPSQHSFDYEAALLQCAAGSHDGIATLYANECNALRNHARHFVRNREQADDVVHDAFAQIIRDARNFDPTRGSARAWVYTIIRNVALKKLCREAREVAVNDDALFKICEQQTGQDPSSHAAEYGALRTCLEELEPRRRASLIFAIVDGRTHAEISGLLGVPIGTVKAWIRRELIMLRKQLR